MAGFPATQDATAEMIAACARAAVFRWRPGRSTSRDEMARLIGQKLDAICTDRPDLLKTLEQRG